MIIAIPVFKNNVSPRLDISDYFWVYDVRNGRIDQTERCDGPFEELGQLISFFKEKKVESVVTGCCPGYLRRILGYFNIELIYGGTGVPDDVIRCLLEGNDISTIRTRRRACWRNRAGENDNKPRQYDYDNDSNQ